MYHLSGQQADVERVKALTRILEEAKDKRAEKGHKIFEGDIRIEFTAETQRAAEKKRTPWQMNSKHVGRGFRSGVLA